MTIMMKTGGCKLIFNNKLDNIDLGHLKKINK